MRQRFRLLPVIVGALIGVGVQQAPAETARDPAELMRSWAGARVWLPQDPLRATDVQALETARIAGALILYAHGCDGLSRISDESGRFLARAGHGVIAPDSFAREQKPASCVPARHQGSLHRAVLSWRHGELSHALEQIGAISALRDLPIVLMGHSEGAIAVATFQGPPVAARIIEGWTCHAGWPEYRGLAAPVEEPVLALLGAMDPWFRLPVLQGDCGAFMHDHRAGQSMVFQPPNHLHNRHWLTVDPEVRGLVTSFIEDSLTRSIRDR